MPWIALGALCGAVSVVAGAFGAHFLAARLTPKEVELWETASRYLMYGGLAQLLLGLFSHQAARRFDGTGWCLFLGCAIFSGTLFGLALGGPRWLGAVTPVGGTLLILGFLLFAIQAPRH
jgi:uncharacterized membrane protein YgdD (TMEM256/DUF423 family)